MSRNRISSRIRSMPTSGIRRFFDIAATMPDVISLGVGEPDFITPAAIRAAGQRSIDQTTSYTSNSGMLELREAIAAHLEHRYRVSYNPETEILITVGVSEGLQTTAMALLDPGDEVVVPEPCFVAYPGSILLASGRPAFVPTDAADAFQVTGAAIEAAITENTRAIMIGYPCNPTGAVMSRERLLEVAAVAEQHNLIVISDEIYDQLVYGIDHICFSSLPGMRERTVLLGGFSKAYAMTGWRLGWLAAPADIVEAASKAHQYMIMSAPTMSQHAAIEALAHGQDAVRAMVAEYDRRRRVLVTGLNAIGLPTIEPLGAFYAFPYVGHLGLSSDEFADRLLMEEQVAVVPGDAFGPSGAGYLRVCYATALPQIEEALERMERFMRRSGWLESLSLESGISHHARRVEQRVLQPDATIR